MIRIGHHENRIRRNNRNRRGVAATEFAACLPLMLLLLLGMLEACSMIFLKQSLAVAAYEGAHTAIAPDAKDADVQRSSHQVLKERRVQGGTVEIIPGSLNSINEGEFLEVRVSAPTDANSILPARFYRGMTLRSSARMMMEL